MSNLNSRVDFDCPFQVTATGEVVDNSDAFAPDALHDAWHDMLIDGAPYRKNGTWEALVGYTGQHGYIGPVMHPSEFIGGRLEADILQTPGVYVVVSVETDDPDNPVGWAVLRHRNLGC